MSVLPESYEPSEKPSAEYDGVDLEAMAFAENYHRWIVDSFRPYLGASVAEIGAGCGNFSALLLKEAGLDRLCSFEPSYDMHSLMENRLREQPRFAAYNDFLSAKAGEFQEAFDAVVYNNVMEHVPDDVAEVRLARQTLKPGGHLLIFVPALSWLYSDFDRSLGHYRRYNKKDGVKLLADAGFQVLKARYVDLPGILPWLLFMKLLGQRLSPGKVSLYDKLVVPLTRAVESRCSPPVGKNLLLVGRKR